ncbi:MAG: HNH endonuclease [Magnetococcus sp. YQC-5]
MSNQRKYPLSQVKILTMRSGGVCAFSNCHKELVVSATPTDEVKQISTIAHIVGHSDDGPRGNPGFPRDQLDTYENWILLCPTCHLVVDSQSNTYTVAKLKTIKLEHENWVRSSLAAEMRKVGFFELEIIIKDISSPPDMPAEDFTVTAPREKMVRNQLSNQIGQLILMGMIRTREVSNYLQKMSTFDHDFSERLKSGFITAYRRFRNEGLVDDALFEAMHEFASGGSKDIKWQAAGLAVLVYLFERCEVFEK